MFTEYFTRSSQVLLETLEENIRKRGVELPGKEKDLNIYQEFFTFMRDHLPQEYTLATGKVRSKKHILNRSCDLLIYNKLCSRFLSMTGGYVTIDSLYSFITLETELSTGSLIAHATLTRALKSLYESVKEAKDNEVIPVFSILFAYKSSIPLLSHKLAIKDNSREKGINVNNEVDMVCILNQGLIIKDWENGGDYKGVETGPDTLMWFYILLMEYLDREGRVNLRDYIKTVKEFREY